MAEQAPRPGSRRTESLADILKSLNSEETAQKNLKSLRERAEEFLVAANRSWYEALGIDTTTDEKIIREAYLNLVRAFHGDSTDQLLENIAYRFPGLSGEVGATRHALEEAVKKLNEIKDSFLHPIKGKQNREMYIARVYRRRNAKTDSVFGDFTSLFDNAFTGDMFAPNWLNNIFGSPQKPSSAAAETYTQATEATREKTELLRQMSILKLKILRATNLYQVADLFQVFLIDNPTAREESFSHPFGNISVETVRDLVDNCVADANFNVADVFTPIALKNRVIIKINQLILEHRKQYGSQPKPVERPAETIPASPVPERSGPKPENKPLSSSEQLTLAMRLKVLKDALYTAKDLAEAVQVLEKFITKSSSGNDQPLVDDIPESSPEALFHLIELFQNGQLDLEQTFLKADSQDELVRALRQKLTAYKQGLRTPSSEPVGPVHSEPEPVEIELEPVESGPEPAPAPVITPAPVLTPVQPEPPLTEVRVQAAPPEPSPPPPPKKPEETPKPPTTRPAKLEFESAEILDLRQELLQAATLEAARKILGMYRGRAEGKLICLDPPLTFGEVNLLVFALTRPNAKVTPEQAHFLITFSRDSLGKHLSDLVKLLHQ